METAALQTILPRASLQECVREYQVFRFVFDKGTTPPPKLHAPRPEHCLTFYAREGQKFSSLAGDDIREYPPCVVSGLLNRPIYRYGAHDFWAIKVVLRPGAFFRLLHIPATHLTNTFINAEDVWGTPVRRVCERVANSTNLAEMLAIIEVFLESLARKTLASPQPIDRAVMSLAGVGAAHSVETLANQACLSLRQFIRKFEERIGVSATTYQRIVRFDKAFRLKNNRPTADWLSVALATGYCDYQHLAKDFKAFTTFTPPAFYEIEQTSPERKFGLHEG
ncbi:helix-turn-helix domain-containing protein [Hymenobacter rubidus]|uniref:helix-turn-helix domain-containing protein n=1 Tax=Hymenobacter rubidus TaxID=1441626 RepID=UPI00191F0F61|nr:helix-turn-helix domain-containing protein [Hymenobacter rubidus]